MCVEVGRVRVDDAPDRLQTKQKTLQHDEIGISSVITIKLSSRIKVFVSW